MRQAENPKDALAILAADGDVDLVFTDIVMPGGMTGIDLAAVVRNLAEKIRSMPDGVVHS